MKVMRQGSEFRGLASCIYQFSINTIGYGVIRCGDREAKKTRR